MQYDGTFHPTDLIAIPRSQEDDAHNVQAVIDSLALDYLQVSLSHITGWYILEIIRHFSKIISSVGSLEPEPRQSNGMFKARAHENFVRGD